MLLSENPVGKQAITFKLCYERFIHAEFMTHRVSRNASSARAIPFKKMKEWISNDPAMHLHLGSDRPGMQSGAQIENIKECKKDILQFLDNSFDFCDNLHDFYGLHKEIVNRYIETFSWINVVATFNREAFMNMLSLRLTPYAHPNFQRLAKYMALEYQNNRRTRQLLNPGEWHLPFIEDKWNNMMYGYPSIENCNNAKVHTLDELIHWSAARATWVSYETVDGKKAEYKDAKHRHDEAIRLKHMTPLEHIKECRDDDRCNGGTTPGFNEYRHMIPGESSNTFDFSVLDTVYKDRDFVVKS